MAEQLEGAARQQDGPVPALSNLSTLPAVRPEKVPAPTVRFPPEPATPEPETVTIPWLTVRPFWVLLPVRVRVPLPDLVRRNAPLTLPLRVMSPPDAPLSRLTLEVPTDEAAARVRLPESVAADEELFVSAASALAAAPRLARPVPLMVTGSAKVSPLRSRTPPLETVVPAVASPRAPACPARRTAPEPTVTAESSVAALSALKVTLP
jgi:hypothetical protein